MNKPWFHSAILLFLDTIATVAGLWVAYSIWIWINPQLENIVQVQLRELIFPNPWHPPVLAIIPAWILANRLQGLYNPLRLESSVKIASGIMRTGVYVMVLLIVLQFLVTDRNYSRLLMLLITGSTLFSMTFLRLAFYQVQIRLPHPIATQKVLIFGIGLDALSMTKRLERYGRHTYEIVGYMAPMERQAIKVPIEDVLGSVEDLGQVVNRHNVDIVLIATRHTSRHESYRLASQCDSMGLRVLQMPFTWGFASPKLSFASLGGLQLIDMQYLSYPSFAENLKRVFDLIAVLSGGTILLPFLLVVAVLIKLESAGPVFFISPRVGKGGRNFPFYKFRSMVANANELKDQLREQNESDGRLFKMKHDPRITRLGSFIRKFSIDELPQLWNVIRGDMNLVGPRPLPSEDLEGIKDDPEAYYWFELRNKVKPGITGLWQVSGRSNLTFADMVSLDIQYVQNWSLMLDIQILLKTIPAVLKSSGAS